MSKNYSSFFNSPFMLTVFGGVMISLVTLVWQSTESHYLREQQYRSNRYEIKLDLLKTSARDLSTSMSILIDVKVRETWLLKQQYGERIQSFYDSRSFVETRDYYEQLKREYLAFGSHDYILAQITALYESDGVAETASTLDAELDALSDSQEMTKAHVLFSSANDIYEKLVEEMARELVSEREER